MDAWERNSCRSCRFPSAPAACFFFVCCCTDFFLFCSFSHGREKLLHFCLPAVRFVPHTHYHQSTINAINSDRWRSHPHPAAAVVFHPPIFCFPFNSHSILNWSVWIKRWNLFSHSIPPTVKRRRRRKRKPLPPTNAPTMRLSRMPRMKGAWNFRL